MTLYDRIVEKWTSRPLSTQLVVVGDYMLDQYIIGDVNRISPEAPIPVISVTSESDRLGGAGNVVSNLACLGAQVSCFPFVGSDDASQRLLRLFDQPMISTFPLKHSSVRTIVKARVVARKQQMVRIDWDPDRQYSYPHELKSELLGHLRSQIKNIRTIILSDYGKGVLDRDFIQSIFQEAKQHQVRCFVDPKQTDYTFYQGCTSITPNTKEAFEATGIEVTDDISAEKAARKIQALTHATSVFITRAEKGITAFDTEKDRVEHFPAVALEVFDVSGAGDTVISMLALGQELGFSSFESAIMANIAASVVVSHFGTVPCTQVEFLNAAQKFFQAL